MVEMHAVLIHSRDRVRGQSAVWDSNKSQSLHAIWIQRKLTWRFLKLIGKLCNREWRRCLENCKCHVCTDQRPSLNFRCKENRRFLNLVPNVGQISPCSPTTCVSTLDSPVLCGAWQVMCWSTVVLCNAHHILGKGARLAAIWSNHIINTAGLSASDQIASQSLENVSAKTF